ncbi:MAG: hypothetical protein V4667_05650 [Bacteroidota bacterium]
MFSKRFFVGWIVSAIVMFSLSYVWHGVILTDFQRISYPFSVFLIIAILVYLIIGFAISTAMVKINSERFKRKPIQRALIYSSALGVFLYLVAMVVGVSFMKNVSVPFILIDLSWQIIEQSFGGLVIGLAYYFIYEPQHDDHLLEEEI